MLKHLCIITEATKSQRWNIAQAIKGLRALLRTKPPKYWDCTCQACDLAEMHADEERHVFSAIMVIGSILLAGLLLISSCRLAHAEALTDKTAAMALIGEAEGESQTCRIAIGEVIRKRASLKGIYGVHAKRVLEHKYSAKSALLARAAWFDSRYTNYSKNADGWGCSEDIKKFKRSAWFKNCKVVAQIDRTYFWKRGA